MINVASYIRMILTKKGWSNNQLRDEINSIEAKLGDARTRSSDITNYLNGRLEFRPKMLVKWEKALGLKSGTLVNMVSPPITKEGKLELKEIIDKVNKLC